MPPGSNERVCNRPDAMCAMLKSDLNAETYIDVLGQQLVGHAVFLENVVVGAISRSRGAEEEAEEAGSIVSMLLIAPSSPSF